MRSLRIVIGLVATLVLDMVVEVDFSVDAPEWHMLVTIASHCVLVRSDYVPLMVHEDDDHFCRPHAITLLGIRLGIRIRILHRTAHADRL